MIVSSSQVLLSLMIGAEVFVIAALWPLSAWATAHRHATWFATALAVIALCFGLDLHSLAFTVIEDTATHSAIARLLQLAVLPLFVALPAAVCVASGESLTRAGVSRHAARTTALLVGALAVVMSPFAALAAGCGLAGACF